MKNSVFVYALLLLTCITYAADCDFTNQNPKQYSQKINPVFWCNTFRLTVFIGAIGDTPVPVSTSFTVCCVGTLWQTCFSPKPGQPGNYMVPIYLTEMDPRIIKDITSKEIKEMTISESSAFEVEKSSYYAIQKGRYPIVKNEKGLFIEAVLEKIK